MFLKAITIVGTLLGMAYSVLALWSARKFLLKSRSAVRTNFTPPVSILKPLCGIDPQSYENLRSHCVQDYPEFEIIFGVSDPKDPIIPTVERVINEFPHIPIRLLLCPETLGLNFKVSNLIQMLPAARRQYLVINDSDISVPSGYLRRVISPLIDQSVGLVTCLYRGIASATLGSKMESLAISSDFVAGVLCADEVEGGIHFGLGSTLAFRRSTLDAIGGLAPLLDYLADDFEIGQRIFNAGLQVEIADCTVDHHLPGYSLAGFFEHQLRWARGIRNSRPAGYAGLVVTFAFPWSVLALIASRGENWGWALVAAVLAFRLAVTFVTGLLVLGDRQVLRDFWLLPIRDFIGLLLWICSYMGRHVVWRGNRFELTNGKLREA